MARLLYRAQSLGFAAALTLVSRSFLIRDLLCGRARSTARRSTAFSHTSTLVNPSRINRLDAILVEPALCSHLFPAGKGADSAHCLDHSHRENVLAEFSRRTARSAKRATSLPDSASFASHPCAKGRLAAPTSSARIAQSRKPRLARSAGLPKAGARPLPQEPGAASASHRCRAAGA
jgi:hypothetical protein